MWNWLKIQFVLLTFSKRSKRPRNLIINCKTHQIELAQGKKSLKVNWIKVKVMEFFKLMKNDSQSLIDSCGKYQISSSCIYWLWSDTCSKECGNYFLDMEQFSWKWSTVNGILNMTLRKKLKEIWVWTWIRLNWHALHIYYYVCLKYVKTSIWCCFCHTKSVSFFSHSFVW